MVMYKIMFELIIWLQNSIIINEEVQNKGFSVYIKKYKKILSTVKYKKLIFEQKKCFSTRFSVTVYFKVSTFSI